MSGVMEGKENNEEVDLMKMISFKPMVPNLKQVSESIGGLAKTEV